MEKSAADKQATALLQCQFKNLRIIYRYMFISVRYISEI